MIVTLCNQKGGAGKTTLTFLLASAFSQIGKSVAIVDRDPQQTATRTVQQLQKLDSTKIELADAPGKHDITFFDTAPRLDADLASCLKISHSIVLVSSPSPADLWSTQESRDFVMDNAGEGVVPRLLFNGVVKSARLARDLEAIAAAIGVKPFNRYLSRKIIFQYSILQGWDALKPSDKTEVQEIALELLV